MATEVQKQPFPKAAFFLLPNEVFERFYYYGMTSIIVIYLNTVLDMSETHVKSLFHTFSMLVYFFPIPGAIISDSWWGKYTTSVVFTSVYVAGSVLLALTTFTALRLPQVELTIISMMLIALSCGLIKPCIVAFGGDQFKLPEQQKQMGTYYSMFYFSINVGSLIAIALTPVLRSEVDCFGETGCYPLAFSFPTVFMILALVFFAVGKPFYNILKPEGNVCVNVVKCICYAVYHRKEEPEVTYWLDKSEQKYGQQLVKDIKVVGRVLIMFLPLPIYWALYFQQNSTWVLQASKMDGDIGFYTILPEQMQMINPLSVLIFLPLFSQFLYPLLYKCHIMRTPLQKMAVGGFVTAGTFCISGFIALVLEKSDPILPGAGEAHLRIYDPTQCNYQINVSKGEFAKTLSGRKVGDYLEALSLPLNEKREKATLEFIEVENSAICPKRTIDMALTENEAFYIYLNYDGIHMFSDRTEKSKSGQPLLRTIFARRNETADYEYSESQKHKYELNIDGKGTIRNFEVLDISGKWSVTINKHEEILEFRPGGAYVALVDSARKSIRLITMFKPSGLHILWALPQFLLITMGEILFSVAEMEFVYSEAPISMKSVVQALDLLTASLGNLLVLVIEQAHFFRQDSYTFFLYSGLMILDLILFSVLAIRYKYTVITDQAPSTT